MNKKFIAGIALLFFLIFGYSRLTTATLPQYPAITVGIVAPVNIPAMTEIIAGFKQGLNENYLWHIHYIVDNAQGDMNIMRASFQQLKAQNVQLVIPIGTAAAQMAASVNHSQPIVALAAQFKDKERAKFKNKNITNILDEIDINKQIRFIHNAFPKLKYITLIYGIEPQVLPEANKAVTAAKHYGITVQKLMVTNLPKLYTISRHIDNNSQAIFILKDELIVSGINTLVKQAAQKHLLLIASDDGSVKKGADFAVGVSERLIGVGGAKLAAQVLKGKAPRDIPVKIMKHYYVYVNPHYKDAAYAKNIQTPIAQFTFKKVKRAAQKFNYPIKILTPLKN